MVAERRVFVPAGAVTGVGSLPYPSAQQAVEAVQRLCPEAPFWPQLPKRSSSEGIISQGLGILGELVEPRESGFGYEVKDGQIDAVVQLLHRSDGALREESAAGFFSFEAALLAGGFASARAVKGQIEGPITLAAYLYYKGQPFLSDAALFSAVAFHVSQMVCWQVERLRGAGLPVLFFVDEPALCLEASTAAEEQFLSALAATLADARARGAYAGLHCCAASPFQRMCQVGADILSFDAHAGLEQFFLLSDARNFVQSGGLVAYGLIPTRRSLADLDAHTIFRRWFAAAAMAGDPQELARAAMVTATCGFGMLDEGSVEESFALADAVGAMLRKLAG